MTISKQHNDGDYLCKWFKGATSAQGHYPEHVLDKYVPPAKT